MSSGAPQATVDSSDDEDLKLAIALSLKDGEVSAKTSPAKHHNDRPKTSSKEAIALDSDEDDDNLDLPYRASKLGAEAETESEAEPEGGAEVGYGVGHGIGSGDSIFTRSYDETFKSGANAKGSAQVSGHVKGEGVDRSSKETRSRTTTLTAGGILGLNRAAMEAERLVRASKRKAPISPPPLQRDRKRNNTERTPPEKKKKMEPTVVAPRTPTRPKSPPDLEIVECEPKSKGVEKPKSTGPKEQRSNPLISPKRRSESDFEIISSTSSPAAAKKKVSTPSHPPLHLRPSHSKPSPELEILPAKPITYATPKLTGLAYPHGAVLKTWVFGYERSNDIKIAEVLQRNTLNLAVISSFQWDMEWLYRQIRCDRNIKLIFVMQAKGEAQRIQYREETKDAVNLQLCFPPMEGNVHCMHSKLMLLSHPGYLRVVVPTANFTPYDWGETGGVMENSVFLIDLPRLSEGKRVALEEMTGFGRDLVYFLEAMGLQKDVMQSLYAFDFSATKDMAFVHTIGGAHTGQAWRKTGYCGLGTAVRELGLATELELDVDYITSSIGSINREFLATLYLAAQGDDGMKEYTSRYGAANAGVGSRVREQAPTALPSGFLESIEDQFRIFFPSEETVVSSKGGKDCAGVICFQEKWWYGPNFPRKALRDCKSRREGLLMHNKIMYVQPRIKQRLISPSCKAWSYVGSANLSEAAWGKLVRDRSSKTPKLNCRNWECGVLVPIQPLEGMGETLPKSSRPSSTSHSSPSATRDLKAFEPKIPVPIEYPGEVLGVRKPWFMSFADQGM